MTILVIILATILAATALVHALWGIGVWFPIRDEERLVRCVVGAAGATRMPGPIPCALVSAGLIVVIFALFADTSGLRNVILSVGAAAFIARGCLSWVPMWRKMTSQEPFATLDRRVYGPVCLILGAGVLVVLAS